MLEALRDLSTVFGPRRAVLARELTKLHETVHSAPLADLLDWVEADENQRKGEFVLMLAGADAGRCIVDGYGRLLTILLEELPLKQAASLAARISGKKRTCCTSGRWSCTGVDGLASRCAWPRVHRGVGQTIAVAVRRRRKVRAPQGKRPGNAWAARVDGKCNRKQTAYAAGFVPVAGKGERVR